MKQLELVREVELSNGSKLAFWYGENKDSEIVHAFLVPDGQDDVDWDFEVVSPEIAEKLMTMK